MEKKLKSWQGWLLFCGAMAVVFVLGLVVSSLMERMAETVSVFNNKHFVPGFYSGNLHPFVIENTYRFRPALHQ